MNFDLGDLELASIVVELPAERSYAGALSVRDDSGKVVAGPFPVCGRASDKPAAMHGNPNRSALLCYGDTPLGDYRILETSDSGEGTSYPAETYGPHGVLILRPVAGEAALSEANGRFFLLIQGGSAARLRPTNGSLRLFDEDQRALLSIVRKLGAILCSCYEAKKNQTGLAVNCTLADWAADPPPEPLHRKQLACSSAVTASSKLGNKRRTQENHARSTEEVLLPNEEVSPALGARNLRGAPKRSLRKNLINETRWQALVSEMPAKQYFEAALWRLWTGRPWAELPKGYPPAAHCLQQVRCWYENGIWVPLWRKYANQLSPRERLAWSRSFLDPRYAPEKDGSRESLFDFGFYWTTAKLFLSSWSAPVIQTRHDSNSRMLGAKAKLSPERQKSGVRDTRTRIKRAEGSAPRLDRQG